MCPAPNSSSSRKRLILVLMAPALPRRTFLGPIKQSISPFPPRPLRLPVWFPVKLRPSQRGSCGRSPPEKCAFLPWNSFDRLSKSRQFLALFHLTWVVLLRPSYPLRCRALFHTLYSSFVIGYARNLGATILGGHVWVQYEWSLACST
jgi:hypothetical protein